MPSHRRWIVTTLLLTIFLLVIPSTPRAYGAATPCQPTLASCSISILSPGGILNTNKNVNSSFILSFAVHNFTLVQPGTGKSGIGTDVNTTFTVGSTKGNEGHIHVWVDGAYITIWASPDGIPLTLTPGSHTIRLDLVNDFHQTFSPGINATTTVNVASPLQSTVNTAQSDASNAKAFSLGALVVSIIVLILVAYNAFKPKKKSS